MNDAMGMTRAHDPAVHVVRACTKIPSASCTLRTPIFAAAFAFAASRARPCSASLVAAALVRYVRAHHQREENSVRWRAMLLFFHPVSELRLGMRGPRTPTPSGAVGWLGIGGRGGCV